MRHGAPRFERTSGHAIEDAWDENLDELMVIEPEVPLIEEPVAEDEAVQLEGEKSKACPSMIMRK